MQTTKQKKTFLSILCFILCLSLIFSSYNFVNATTIFSDGFESGDFSAWTSTVGAPIIVESPVHHGTYAAEFAVSKNCYKTLTAADLFYARGYFYFASIGSEDYTLSDIMLLYSTSDHTVKTGAVLRRTGGNATIQLANWDGTFTNTGITPSLDTWYCVEIAFFKDSSGWSKIWVNGALTQKTGDTSAASQYNRFYAGNVNWGGITVSFYGDCVVVADAYIGPEEEEEYNSLTLQLETPANASTAASYTQTMNYTPTLLGTDSFHNATLYVNGTAQATNQTAITNATLNSITYIFPGANATYLWDIQVYNSTHPVFSSNGNFTLNVAISSGGVDETALNDEHLAIAVVGLTVASILAVATYHFKKKK